MDQRIDVACTHAHAHQVLAVAPNRRIFLGAHWLFTAARRLLQLCCGTLECADSVVVAHWAYLPPGMWALSSPTRDRTRVPCMGRQILNHRTTQGRPRMGLPS